MSKLDLVTVIYYRELLLLKLQARSIAAFVDHSAIGQIVVVVNEDTPAQTLATMEAIREEVVVEYGRLGERLRIIDGATLHQAEIASNGWRKQQTLKLLVARELQSECYVALDGKNHFIRPVDAATFLDATGKMRSFRARQQGSLNKFFVSSCSYFGVDPERYVNAAMPATTPFVLSTTLVREMIDFIEKKESCTFTEFFHAPRRNVTEFFLYFAFLVANHSPIEDVYAFGKRIAVTLFTRWPDTPERVHAALDKLSDASSVVFGLHSNRLPALDAAAIETICRCWVACGLVRSMLEAHELVADLTYMARTGLLPNREASREPSAQTA
jgi:hypothetical protein